jgi:Peptidase C13 family
MTYWVDLKQALHNGARLWALREPVLHNRLIHWVVVPLLAIAVSAVLLLGDWLANSDAPRRFYQGGAYNIIVVLSLIGLLSWCLSRRLQNYVLDIFGQLTAHLLSALLIFVLLYMAVQTIAPIGYIAFLLTVLVKAAFLFGVLVYTVRCLHWVTQLPASVWAKYGAYLALIPAGLVTAQMNHFDGSAFWYSAASFASEPSFSKETVLLRQQQVLKDSLDQLEAQRSGEINVYFVSYAPDASEEVFKRETDVIQKVMQERFRAQGKSIRLINHEATGGLYPAATYGHLQSVLARIATLMNREEDVLVLYLTSHGSRKHELSANWGSAQLIQITPVNLRELLDKSKIQNKVVIVSACFSGGYIEPLKSDTTLVMTASAAEKTSFGCGNESDFTYFGKALFDEQLRKTTSFEKAFQAALPVIAAREAQVGKVEPSNPQMSVGSKIKTVLANLDQQLAEQLKTAVQPNAPIPAQADAVKPIVVAGAVAAAGAVVAKKRIDKAKKKTKTDKVKKAVKKAKKR